MWNNDLKVKWDQNKKEHSSQKEQTVNQNWVWKEYLINGKILWNLAKFTGIKDQSSYIINSFLTKSEQKSISLTKDLINCAKDLTRKSSDWIAIYKN